MLAVRCDTWVHRSEGMIECMSSSDRVNGLQVHWQVLTRESPHRPVYKAVRLNGKESPSCFHNGNQPFVPGRTKDTENPVHNGYRFINYKRRDDSCYWKFSDSRKPESQLWTSSSSMDCCRESKVQPSIRISHYLPIWRSFPPTMKIPGLVLQPQILSTITTCGPARYLPADWHHGSHTMMSCSKPTVRNFLDCLKAERSLRRQADWATTTLDFLRSVGCLTMR